MLAFYTCYTGGDSGCSNQVRNVPSKEHDCYYFTNNPGTYARAKDMGWMPILLDYPVENDQIKDCQATKLLRCCPHLFEPLNRYEYLCYMDSKMETTSLEKIIELQTILHNSSDLVLAITLHPSSFTSVWGEFNEAMGQERYKKHESNYIQYIESQLRAGYKDIPQRHCCGFSVRKQNDIMRRIGERWYSHICRCGIEDQISWQFIIQDFPTAVYEVPYKYCWN
jgi:hypothetical protein